MMNKLTVFTPTFNRRYRLHQLYESLCRQTCQDFDWLIVDDGSSDNTKSLVDNWISEDKLKITYIYQENQGVAVAHETALYNIDTELNVCIDSDDYMPDDAVEKILHFWTNKKSEDVAGFICLDAYQEGGEIIGDRFPEDLHKTSFSDMTEKYKIKGDKKAVNRTKLCKKYLPFPRFENEKFPTVSYLYLLINREKKYLLLNEVICLVEYLPDGISMNKNSHYQKYPNGFMVFRKEKMRCAPNWTVRFRHAVHFVSSCFFAKRIDQIFKGNQFKITTFLALPFGIGFYLYIKYSGSRSLNRNLNK